MVAHACRFWDTSAVRIVITSSNIDIRKKMTQHRSLVDCFRRSVSIGHRQSRKTSSLDGRLSAVVTRNNNVPGAVFLFLSCIYHCNGLDIFVSAMLDVHQRTVIIRERKNCRFAGSFPVFRGSSGTVTFFSGTHTISDGTAIRC